MSCEIKNPVDFYHRFPEHSWYRFDLLRFEIPVSEGNMSYDLYFFIRHDHTIEFNTLDFNMVMNTPSGEERIRAYQMEIMKKNGIFTGECGKDSCEAIVLLKKGIRLGKKGHLMIEIENLVPKMEIKGILGAGIRMVPGS